MVADMVATNGLQTVANLIVFIDIDELAGQNLCLWVGNCFCFSLITSNRIAYSLQLAGMVAEERGWVN